MVAGFVHRVHRACSSDGNFLASLSKVKDVLERNQYPLQFYQPIVEATLKKIQSAPGNNVNVESEEESKKMVILNYRGKVTDHFIRKLKAVGVPFNPVLTLQKLKSVLPSLKCKVPDLLKSGVVYQLSCPCCNACYVGRTDRHLITRFSEHKTKSKQPVRKHFKSCGLDKPSTNDIRVLRSTTRNNLNVLAALYIREIKPALNTQDEFQDHELLIKI